MGHVAKRNGKWIARYRGPDGRERSRSFARKVDAERFLVQIQADLMRGAYVDPKAGRVTVETYGQAWAETQAWRAQSRQRMESLLRLQVYPVLGSRPLGSLRSSEVQGWVSGLAAAGYAPKTVEAAYRVLSSLLAAAARDRIIVESPAHRIRLPRGVSEPVVPLSIIQVEAIAAAMPSRLAAIVPTAAGLGLRRGEAIALTVDRVDFLRRVVRVDRQLIGGRFAPPKTEASNRVIPLPGSVAEVLAEHLRVVGTGERGLVFTREGGEPLTPSALHGAFTGACRRAGVETTFHQLRHFTASALISAGCSVKGVQSYLGHAKASETLDTYSHLWPSDEDRIRGAVDAVLSAPTGQPRDASAEPG